MFKLLSFLLFVAFLFASALPDYSLIVNKQGVLQVVKLSKQRQAKDITATPTIFVVEASCNGPPAIS